MSERFNFSDQVACGKVTLYLQTHTTEAPWAAESLLYEQGRIVAKKCVDLSHLEDTHLLQKSAETCHMNNLDELETACRIMAAPLSDAAEGQVLKAAGVLLRWNLFTRVLHVLDACSGALYGDITYWLLKAEALLALNEYAAALEALKQAKGVDRNSDAVLPLLAKTLLTAAVEQGNRLPDEDRTRLLLQTETCLARLADRTDESGELARQAAELMRRGRYTDALKSLHPGVSGQQESG